MQYIPKFAPLRMAWLELTKSSLLVIFALLNFGVVSGVQAAPNAVAGTQFSVSDGGGASVSIPIQVPRGIGGMEPQLSLSYSSGGGNGLVGQGWSIQGPSTISRCPQSMLHDGINGAVNFDSSDRFCLDGQRLLVINALEPNSTVRPNQALYGNDGTQYRTERDGFSRIKAVGSFSGQANTPTGFTVETKSGLVLEYGRAAVGGSAHSSQVPVKYSDLVSGRQATISRWLIRQIRDRLGSSVDFEYCLGEISPQTGAPALSTTAVSCDTSKWAGSALPYYIKYTNRNGLSDGKFGVIFRYESRPDRVAQFHAGAATRQTQRLSAIQTFINFDTPSSAFNSTSNTLVRSYDVYYQALTSGTASIRATNTSRVAKIQERAADGAVLPPIAFTMADDSVLGSYVLQGSEASTSTPPVPRCGGAVMNRFMQECP